MAEKSDMQRKLRDLGASKKLGVAFWSPSNKAYSVKRKWKLLYSILGLYKGYIGVILV